MASEYLGDRELTETLLYDEVADPHPAGTPLSQSRQRSETIAMIARERGAGLARCRPQADGPRASPSRPSNARAQPRFAWAFQPA
jgi:hypothetical protein